MELINLDSTRFSTVVLCDECPWFRGIAGDKAEGRRIYDDHETRAHEPRIPLHIR